MDITNKLNSIVQEGQSLYKKILDTENYDYFTIPLNCANLVEPEENKRSKYPLPEKVKECFFVEFDKHNKPSRKLNEKTCLYFIEFPQKESDNILSKYIEYKEYKDINDITRINERNSSGLKKSPNSNTNILYVGKVKKDLGGRLSTHFGYAHPKTGGLQLRHWINKDLELTVHIIAFDDKIDDFVNPLELMLTKKLNPLIGKSK